MVETSTSILDLENEQVGLCPDADGRISHAGMAGHVRQCFLNDPVGSRFHFGEKSAVHSMMLEVNQNPSLFGVALEEREQTRNQPQLVQLCPPASP